LPGVVVTVGAAGGLLAAPADGATPVLCAEFALVPVVFADCTT
jgi:hypothetical protein